MKEAMSLDLSGLYDRHAPFLLRVVERLTASPDAAEDVVQEVFLLAWRKHDVLARHPDPRGWLYLAARNVVQHHRRTLARRSALAEKAASSPPDPGPEPDEAVRRREEGDRIRACVAKLPLEQREVFVLFELEEMEGKEIAAILGIPEGTVWTRLHSARKRFRELWTKRR